MAEYFLDDKGQIFGDSDIDWTKTIQEIDS
jgi:hypothetical protein